MQQAEEQGVSATNPRQKKKDFRQNGFACKQRLAQVCEFALCPRVMRVAPIEQSDDRPGINEHASCHIPSFAPCSWRDLPVRRVSRYMAASPPAATSTSFARLF